jgi:hypothetical protein
MAKPTITDEVQVLRFFETGPIESARVVFNIVSEKMRERLRGANQDHERPAPSGSPRKRNAPGNPKAPGTESAEEGPPK